MSDTQILNALKAIVNSHTQNDSEYYLDKSTCPVGMTPCDGEVVRLSYDGNGSSNLHIRWASVLHLKRVFAHRKRCY